MAGRSQTRSDGASGQGPVTVRLARPGDLARVDMLFARAFPRLLRADYPPSVLVTVVPRLARAQPRLLASGRYFVAEDQDGLMVGAGGWTPLGRWVAEIRHIATDDRAVGRGIGRAILTAALDQARGQGAQSARALSTLTARPFYAALGFAEVGPRRMTLAGGIAFEVVEMSRPL